jgi:hypothetical protein
VALGSLYLLLSVTVSLQHQRNVVLEGSYQRAAHGQGNRRLFRGIARRLGGAWRNTSKMPTTSGGYDSEEARRWSGEGEVWRNRWRVFGERCRLVERRPAPTHKDMEAMAAAYEELGSIQTTYSQELLRFGSELAPRLDRINKRVDEIGEHLATPGSPTGATP